MTDSPALDDLRAHARVEADDEEVRVWLSSPRAFLAVSALAAVGCLTTEAVLVAYALHRSGPGAWAIVVIVSGWLVVVALMIRRRWRSLRSSPSLRLSADALTLGSRTIARASVTDVRFVERQTYTCVEVHADGAVVGITLSRPEQGPPLVALLTS